MIEDLKDYLNEYDDFFDPPDDDLYDDLDEEELEDFSEDIRL